MAQRTPSFLFITSSWPGGTAFGGQLRATHTARALQQIGRLSVLVVSEDRNDSEAHQRCATEFLVLPPIIPSPSPNRGWESKLRRAFDTRFLDLHGVQISTLDRERILKERARHDLTWIFHSRVPSIIGEWHWPRSHLDIDDIPSTYLRSVADTSPSARIRLKARLQQTLLKRRELCLLSRFTTLSVCSEPDRRYLGNPSNVHIIPNGFARPSSSPIRAPQVSPPRIGFIGLYSYSPNREGVQWFIRHCWPQLRSIHPNLRFRMIGKETDGPDGPKGQGIEPLGWVADPTPEIATWSAMVIPILTGGGTRIKIADAFSRKCPVVSTSLGAYGYEVASGRQLLIADNPRHFADHCSRLIHEPTFANEIADNAWALFLKRWTWDSISHQVQAAAQDCMARSSLSQPHSV